eukprot:scaffold129443_cov33-Tisochrysis_lutea.AAC.2
MERSISNDAVAASILHILKCKEPISHRPWAVQAVWRCRGPCSRRHNHTTLVCAQCGTIEGTCACAAS